MNRSPPTPPSGSPPEPSASDYELARRICHPKTHLYNDGVAVMIAAHVAAEKAKDGLLFSQRLVPKLQTELATARAALAQALEDGKHLREALAALGAQAK
jgi:hypothetical protein